MSIQEEFLEPGLKDSRNTNPFRIKVSNDITLSKIQNICYNMRKEHRAYDKAQMLEILAERLLQKNKSVLAIKIQKSHDQVSMIDNLNEIIPLSDPCQIINLLIALKDQGQIDSEYQMSEYALNLLKQKQNNYQDQIVKPDPSEYCHSDTFEIDRNKSLQLKYPQFNNISFENPRFQQLTNESINFQSQMNVKNRFNEALLSNEYHSQTKNKGDSSEDKPTFLFGALKRVQQNQNSDNPFGIKFEIPPLPKIPSLGINSDQQALQEVPNFFSFIRTSDNDSVKQDGNKVKSKNQKVNWLSNNKSKQSEQKSSPPYNRRKIKQIQKNSLTKKSLIWNLMPHLNQSLLSQNLQDSSGIQKLWEDEDIDVQMRDLRVSESGLITQQKMREFNKEYMINTKDQLNLYEKAIFTESEVVQMTLLMLQGVPSKLFLLRNEKLTFFMRSNFEIRGYSLNGETFDNIFGSLLECGSFFLHIREFTEFMQISQNNGGMILQNFVLAISEFLSFYYSQINEISTEVDQRRKCEDEFIFNAFGLNKTQTQPKTQITILELITHTNQLQSQIKLIATICFTQKFIRDLDFQDDVMQVDQEAQPKPLQLQIYNNRNLREQFQLDIEKIRSKVWLENFPKGAKLLSYLYKILLCCESDLQAVDLLRRLFEKATQPLLSMINSFIFTGDYEDPYQEFFIEKLYRRGVSKNVVQLQDYLFKITSKPQEKVPIFLVDSVPLIFKAGSSLHLLRKQGNQLSSYQDSYSVKQYYDICTSGINEISDVKLQKRQNIDFRFNLEEYNQMHLEFSIDKLRLNQEQKAKHFNNQTEILQQIEMAIVQQEEELYYKQVVVREEAKRQYTLKRDQEREKERQMKIDKKEAYLKQIQEQITEFQKRKDDEKLKKVRENEAIRKEQDEYEQRKRAIEEDLKRQLKEALREDQKLGEISKDQGNQDEKDLEHKIQQMIEEKKIDEHQNMNQIHLIHNKVPQQDSINQQVKIKPNDTQMIDEYQEMPQTLKPEETQFIQSNGPEELNNPLLQIINEALTKAKINLDQSIIKEDIRQSQQQNEFEIDKNQILKQENEEMLNLDEIQILEQAQEYKDKDVINELTSEEKSTFIIESFIKPIFQGINKRIDELDSMKRKRYTWNRIKKDQQIQKYQEQKNKWKYKEPAIPIRSKLLSIFDQFEKVSIQSQQHSEQLKQQQSNKQIKPDQQQIETQSKATFNVPVTLSIQQCVVSVIKDQYKLINKCLIHLMFRRLRLFKHLEALKQFYFCNQGDVISLFMTSVFNDDYESTVKENSLSFINEQFDLAIRLTQPEKFQSHDSQDGSQIQLDSFQNFNIQVLGENLDFQAIDPLGMNQNQNFYFTAFNMQDYVKLIYKRKYPLDLVISDQCIDKYNSIFFFLVKLKRINQILSQMWKYLSSTEFRRLPLKEYNKMRSIQLLRNRMHHFTSMLEQYALTEVIQASWQTFKNNLPHQTVFEDLIKLHNEFLDQIMIKCFIDKKDHKIMGQISKLFGFVLQFSKLVKQYGTEIINVKEAINEVKDIQEKFGRYTYYLYQLVKHLAQKGSFKELFLRLDFNKFYDRGDIQKPQTYD